MDKDQSEQPRSQCKLRSSLKRQSRNAGANLDVTDEGQDASLLPQPRRVSFAASRNVKPFLDDPDNNTIWDHTYEEPILSNTDSNNGPSLDSQGNVQDAIGNAGEMQKTLFETDMELTCTNVEETIGNYGEMQKTLFETDMEFTCTNVQETIGNDGEVQKTLFETDMEFMCQTTNFTQYGEVDMSVTRIEQKENIHSIKLHAKSIKSRKTKPLGTNAALMKTTVEGFSLVEPLNDRNVEQPMDTNATITSTKYASPTECQEVDMSLTCKFDNALIVQSVQLQEHSHKPVNICGSNNKEETNCVTDNKQKEEITIPIPEASIIEKGKTKKQTKLTKFNKPKEQSATAVKNAVESGCVDNTIANLESNCTLLKLPPENQTLQENVISKATPAIFVDSATDLSLEPKVLAVVKATSERIPFGQICIAADSSMEESQTKIEQPLDKLSATSKPIHEAIRTDNSSKTLHKNVASKTIFVDSTNELSLESKIHLVEKSKDKRTPFGHISIAADSSVQQSKTIEQLQDNLITRSNTNIESIMDEELSIVDLHNTDCTNIFTPTKVIYSEPMPAVPSTSFFEFTTGLSTPSLTDKKKFLMSTLDGTQQLIEATFSKPQGNESEVSEMDNTDASASALTVAVFKPVKFDYEHILKLARENEDFLGNIRLYFEQESTTSPKPKKSLLDEKVRRLSICSTPKDQSTDDDGVLLEDFLFDSDVLDTSKSMHEKITDIFQNNKKHVVELHAFEENCYVCSTFANLVWFSVKLHPADATVQGMTVSAAIDVDYSKCAWPALYDLIASFIINKLQMDNLKSALCKNFDMLSLLDHVIMVTERSSEFFVEFVQLRLRLKTLDLSDDGTVSFTIYLTHPPTIWKIAFKMASVEAIQQDSLVATTKWDTINQEHLRTILRNTEPGIDCISRFADAVIQYFRKTLNVPADIKMV